MAKKVVAKFEKVSYEQFKEDLIKINPMLYQNHEERIKEVYDSIKLPQRSTKRSSGYDFFYPGVMPTTIIKGRSTTIVTGIRCIFLEDGYDLSIYPRSGMGFKFRLHLDNSTGIIDNDYFESDNEGHIMIKLSCDPRNNISGVTINPGDKFAQGIIREFFLAEEDDEVEKPDRNGGMGSTGE
jgi:dUTP pyrophosphatase